MRHESKVLLTCWLEHCVKNFGLSAKGMQGGGGQYKYQVVIGDVARRLDVLAEVLREELRVVRVNPMNR